MKILGINALFHDPAAVLVVDGEIVAGAEEERFSRRKHGKRPLPFSAWEMPDLSARWCLEHAGIRPEDLDVVAYSFDPGLHLPPEDIGLDDPWDHVRATYARHAPVLLAEVLPGLDPERVRFVPHHVAHAASAGLAAPFAGDTAVLVLDGRGERHSHLSGLYSDGRLQVLASQALPHSLGLLWESVTDHLGFLRSSDEFKVMALASYGTPRHRDLLTSHVHATGDGGFVTEPVDLGALAKRRAPGEDWTADHADLAASVQAVTEELLLDLAGWLRRETGAEDLAVAGGVALNCVANTVLADRGGFRRVWVPPAAGDAGTALGGALAVSWDAGEPTPPLVGAGLGRGWDDDALEAELRRAGVAHRRSDDAAAEAAAVLAADGVVAWFDGRSEFGARALGHRSLLAHPGRVENLRRLNDVKGREQFRPVAPMVRASRAADLFTRGPLPSPAMTFVHDVAPAWRSRIPAVVHVDGTARVQTVDPAEEPRLDRMLARFEELTGLPVVVNTSLNTAGRPMVDSPRDALECVGSSPVDLLVLGPFVVRREWAWRGMAG